MSFRQAAEYSFCFNQKKPFFRICFVKLKLLLVAIEVKDEEANDDTEISINPRQAKTPGNTIGYFWAQSAEEVKRWVNNDDRLKCIECRNFNLVLTYSGPTSSATDAMETSQMKT